MYMRGFRSFPASTLNVIETVAECPRAAAMVLMQVDEHEFDSIWDLFEELPFAWWAVPMADWVGAAKTLYTHYLDQLALLNEQAPETARQAFATFFTRGLERNEFVGAIPAAAFNRWAPQLGFAESPAGQALFFAQRQEARQALLQIHAEEEWPQAPGIEKWKNECWNQTPEQLHSLWFDSPQGVGFQTATLNAPVVAALNVVIGIQCSQELLFQLRNLRAFDARWFDEAYRLTLVLALSNGYDTSTWSLRNVNARALSSGCESDPRTDWPNLRPASGAPEVALRTTRGHTGKFPC